MKEYEILEKAAAIVEEKGWTQGMIQDRETGSVCAIGALAQACDIDLRGDHVYEEVAGRVPAFAETVKPLFEEYLADKLKIIGRDEEYIQRRLDVYNRADYIYEYNDNICQGGLELAEKFRATARKLRVNEKVNHERV